MDFRETELEGIDSIHMAQNRDQWWTLVNIMINFRVPQKAGISQLCEHTVSFSTRTVLEEVTHLMLI
jgi:hypothetical protein